MSAATLPSTPRPPAPTHDAGRVAAVIAGAVLALTPAPPATSLPLPAAPHDALARVGSPVTAAAVQGSIQPHRG